MKLLLALFMTFNAYSIYVCDVDIQFSNIKKVNPDFFKIEKEQDYVISHYIIGSNRNEGTASRKEKVSEESINSSLLFRSVILSDKKPNLPLTIYSQIVEDDMTIVSTIGGINFDTSIFSSEILIKELNKEFKYETQNEFGTFTVTVICN